MEINLQVTVRLPQGYVDRTMERNLQVTVRLPQGYRDRTMEINLQVTVRLPQDIGIGQGITNTSYCPLAARVRIGQGTINLQVTVHLPQGYRDKTRDGFSLRYCPLASGYRDRTRDNKFLSYCPVTSRTQGQDEGVFYLQVIVHLPQGYRDRTREIKQYSHKYICDKVCFLQLENLGYRKGCRMVCYCPLRVPLISKLYFIFFIYPSDAGTRFNASIKLYKVRLTI